MNFNLFLIIKSFGFMPYMCITSQNLFLQYMIVNE